MAQRTDKRTVAQLRQELRELKLVTTGNKQKLLERLRLAIPATKRLKKRDIEHPSKRRRFTEHEQNINETVEENDSEEIIEDEPAITERNVNLEIQQLTEWERSLQHREEAIRIRETELTNNRQDVVELLPQGAPGSELIPSQPFRLALRTIGLRDIIDILPEFNSDNRSTIDARQFVERVTLLKRTYNWEDGLVVMAVQAKLRGNAKIWADTQRNIHHRWEDLGTDLMENFPNHRHESDTHIELPIFDEIQTKA